MSLKLPGGKLIPTVKPLNPLAGQMMFDTLINAFCVYDGVVWQVLKSIGNVCVICKEDHQFDMKTMLIPDHPYCANNLEMLEWKLEQRERRQQAV